MAVKTVNPPLTMYCYFSYGFGKAWVLHCNCKGDCGPSLSIPHNCGTGTTVFGHLHRQYMTLYIHGTTILHYLKNEAAVAA